jgi:hypothetical protein
MARVGVPYPGTGPALQVDGPGGDGTGDILAGSWTAPSSGAFTRPKVGPGAGAIPAGVFFNVPTTFLSGTTLAGSDGTHVVIAGDQTSLVGFYYVATGVANNPSVPLISATFNGTNTTFIISTVIGNTNGITYEISLWPGGTTGRNRGFWDTNPNIVYKPSSARSVLQIGPNTALYQVDTYGTVYLIGFNGTGANADHLRDLKVADLGCDNIELQGTYVAVGSPQGTEPGPIIDGYLGYNGSALKLFRDNINNPRSKSFEAGGIEGLYPPFGNVGLYAQGAIAGTQFRTSPKLRFVGSYWAGGVGPSTDKIAYEQNAVLDNIGTAQLQWGFENRANPAMMLQDAAIALLSPFTDLGLSAGGSFNRWQQFVTGPLGFRIWQNSGDAQPVAQFLGIGGTGAGIFFGPGGAGAPDLGLTRSAAGVLDLTTVNTAAAATAGAAALPANPVAFMVLSINGTLRKIPYYAT